MYRDIPARLRAIVEPIVGDHGLELVDAEERGGRGQGRLRVVLDTPRGDGRVTVDQCAAVSRELSHALDAEDYLSGACMLEVSSPGVDRILAREVDFERAVGQRVSVETDRGIDGRRRFKGQLLEFRDDALVLELGDSKVAIPFARVARANVLYGKPLPGGRAKR